MGSIVFYRSALIEFVIIRDKRLCFDEHCHASNIVLTAVLDGEAELCLNGVTTAAGRDDVFCILPYENHSLRSALPVSTLSMCISKQLALCPRERFGEVVTAAVNGMTDKGLPPHLAGVFIGKAMAAYTAFNERTEAGDPMLLTERRNIEEHPELPDTLDESGRKVFMSKYHFIRRFRGVSGLTPHKFRVQNRVRMAQRCLAEGGTIAEAALMSGFYDQSHFDRYFKKIVGVSPKDYVSSLRNFLQE